MNIMVSREEAIDSINKFLETKRIEDAVVLFKQLCDTEGLSDHPGLVQMCDNPALLTMYIVPTIEKLMVTLNINKITDKHNNLIIVF